MSKWQPIETAPTDGEVIRAKIPGYGSNNKIAFLHGFEGATGDCGAWVWMGDEDKCPECWHNGVCWASNADNNPSAKPSHWKQINSQTKSQPE